MAMLSIMDIATVISGLLSLMMFAVVMCGASSVSLTSNDDEQ
jgi:hypothetical protein